MAYPHSCPVVSGRSVVKLFIGSFLPFMSSARYVRAGRTTLGLMAPLQFTYYHVRFLVKNESTIRLSILDKEHANMLI
jgi:hypothetical protein